MEKLCVWKPTQCLASPTRWRQNLEGVIVGENSLQLESKPQPASKAFVQFLALWARVRQELANGQLFEVSESVLPLPHQRYAMERALAGNQVRYLLADEVGLGKTIEAGLIIKELQTRGLIERVLVVCPKGLVSQWEAEMQEKFGERFLVVRPEDYATLKKVSEDQNLFASFGRVISPMDAIKPLEERAGWDEERIAQHNADRVEAVVAGGWDLIIIDEAHLWLDPAAWPGTAGTPCQPARISCC